MMDKKNPNTSAVAIFAGFALLILGAGIFIFFSSISEKNAYAYLLLVIALAISGLSAFYAYLVYSGKITDVEPDYRTLFIMGLIFLPMAFTSGTAIFPVISLGFIVIGLMNKKKWKGEVRWSEMPPVRKAVIIALVVALGILVFTTMAVWYMAATKKYEEQNNITGLSENEARFIAERDCIKGGESISSGIYNENTKTWWFDANLNAVREGCNPACVVSETLLSAEINWRCTGLIPTVPTTQEAIKNLFRQ